MILEKIRWGAAKKMLGTTGLDVSDRAIAVIASSVLRDVGKITDSDLYYVVDKFKVKRIKIMFGWI